MKKLITPARVLYLAALVVSMGCSTVSSIHPIGARISEDLSSEFTGTWTGSSGHQLQLHCDPDGRLSFATLEWKDDAGEFKIESGSGILTRAADQLFFNFIDDPSDEPPRYTFALLRINDQQLIIWLPDVDRFKTEVEKKTLKGEIHEGDQSKEIILTGSSEEIAGSFAKLELSELFDWSKPALVLVRSSAGS